MSNRNVVRIGSALKWRNTFDIDKTYYRENIVTENGCVFRCKALVAKGKSPVGPPDANGHMTFINTDIWDVIVDTSEYYNLVLESNKLIQSTFDKIAYLDELTQNQQEEIDELKGERPNRGEWALDEQYYAGASGEELSMVWYNGIRWKCIQNHTSNDTNKPGYLSTYWKPIQGDLQPHLTFEEGVTVVAKGRTDNYITAVLTIYGEDISDHQSVTYEWTRLSKFQGVERTTSDSLWNAQSHNGRKLHITDADIGWDSFGGPDNMSFTVTATMKDAGGALKKIRRTINI